MKAVSGKRLCSILEDHGWVLHKIEGSHHIYRKEDSPVRLSIPVHGNRDLKSGTQRALMKAAGLTEGDL